MVHRGAEHTHQNRKGKEGMFKDFVYYIADDSLLLVFLKMLLTGIFSPILTLLMGFGVRFDFN
jgi:hypothetical protein